MAESLSDVLRQVAAKVRQYKTKTIGEQNTKQVLIVPVLRALGWNIEDLEEVRLEFKPKAARNPVDYALLLMRTPRLFVEAKGLGENLQDPKWASQIMGYAAVAGVEWVVLTDGDEWRIYNSHAVVPVDEKLFRSVRISADSAAAERTLALLSKSQMSENAIHLQWECQFVDRQVGKAVGTLFATVDPALVKLVRKQTPSLLPAAIKASLTRLRIALDFPAETISVVEPMQGTSKPKFRVVTAPKEETSDVTGNAARKAVAEWRPWRAVTMVDLLNAGALTTPSTLRLTYNNRTVTGTVRSDGQLEVQGTTYPSPSSAALVALHSLGATWTTVNGWDHWMVSRPDGTFVRLNELRREVFNQSEPPDA